MEVAKQGHDASVRRRRGSRYGGPGNPGARGVQPHRPDDDVFPGAARTFHVLLRPTEQVHGGKAEIDAAKPRVCFYVNKRIDPKSWSIRYHTRDACTLTMKTDSGAIHVHNVYVESKVRDEGDENRQELRTATAKATLQVVGRLLRNSGAGQHVVVGDVNLHHPLWSQTTQSQQEDEDAEDLISIMGDRDMQQDRSRTAPRQCSEF